MNVTHVTIFFRACLSSNWFRSHSSLFLVMFLRVLLLIQMMLLLGMINNFTVSEHGTVQYHPGTRVLIICVKKGKGPPQQGSRGGGFSALAAVRRDEQLHLLSFGRPLAQPLGAHNVGI